MRVCHSISQLTPFCEDCLLSTSTNLVQIGRKELFHLTVPEPEICTKDVMISSIQANPIPQQPSSAITRGYRRVHGSWRKVATGAAALLALALGYHVVFGQNGLTVYQQKRQETQILNEQLGRLQRENGLLQGHVERLQSDPSAIEHQAREELHYARPDEVIYTMPASPLTADVTSRSGSGGR